MRTKVAITLLLAWIFWTTAGCTTLTCRTNGPSAKDSGLDEAESDYAGSIGAARDPSHVLPPDIAGIWKAQDSPWQLVISGDGTVSSAVITMGEVEIKPNQTTKVEMKDGSFSTFTAGDCVVEYTPKTRELFVSVQLKHIYVRFLDNVIDGNSIDRFVGPVSQDGKIWMADWITIFDYGPHFPQEPNDIFAKPLIFEKTK